MGPKCIAPYYRAFGQARNFQMSEYASFSKLRRNLSQKILHIAIFPISANAPMLNYISVKQRHLDSGGPPYWIAPYLRIYGEKRIPGCGERLHRYATL